MLTSIQSDHLPALVVTNDKTTVNLIQEIISANQFSLTTAATEESALDLLQQQHFSIVILDLSCFTRTEGYAEICQAIRKQTKDDYTYILLITEKSHDKTEALLQIGADDLICSPLSSIELLSRLYAAKKTLSAQNKIQQLQTQIDEKNQLDVLTKTHSRARFMEILSTELRRSARYQRPISVMLLNIDSISNINALYGNKIGDITLQYIAQIILDQLRTVDIIGRIGGDEFAMILPETEAGHAISVAERMRLVIADSKLEILNRAIRVSVRIGVAGIDKVDIKEHTPDAIISYAKFFVDESRPEGGNKVAGFNISDDESAEDELE